jgi:hypothetical protein
MEISCIYEALDNNHKGSISHGTALVALKTLAISRSRQSLLDVISLPESVSQQQFIELANSIV